MKRGEKTDPFAYHLEEDDLKRERHKARELRESQWWKRRLAKGACHYCGRMFPPRELTMDHIVPVSRGGRTTKGNVVAVLQGMQQREKAAPAHGVGRPPSTLWPNPPGTAPQVGPRRGR